MENPYRHLSNEELIHRANTIPLTMLEKTLLLRLEETTGSNRAHNSGDKQGSSLRAYFPEYPLSKFPKI